MDGHYLNKTDEYKIYLHKWVESAIQIKSWEKHNDLHLNQIDYCFKSEENWVDGALFIYPLLSEIISEQPYRCLLVIPLSYSDSKTNLNNLSHSLIKKELDITPPSFIYFLMRMQIMRIP